MTVLDPDFHGKVHFPVKLIFTIMALIALALHWVMNPIGVQNADPVAASNVQACATDAPGCEMNWMLENLTNIEQPILVLTPGSH